MEFLKCRDVRWKGPKKRDKPDVAATTAKHPDERSQISRYGWMQPTCMRSVSFWGKFTSGSRISASRSDLLKVPTNALRSSYLLYAWGLGMAKEDDKDKATPPYTFFFLFEIANKFITWGGGRWCTTSLRDKWFRETTTWNTFITQATDLLCLKNRSEDFARFALLVSASVFVYGSSLVMLLKYLEADLQRRNKFERTILVNLRLALSGLGRGF